MSDNKRKKKADGKRVALTQEHERAYMLTQLCAIVYELAKAQSRVNTLADRLRAGFPAAASKKEKRRGAK